jgi:hypothetical protein
MPAFRRTDKTAAETARSDMVILLHRMIAASSGGF